MEIRGHLVRLHRLKIGPEILRLHGATLYDLELLAIAEDELNRKEEGDDGCAMYTES